MFEEDEDFPKDEEELLFTNTTMRVRYGKILLISIVKLATNDERFMMIERHIHHIPIHHSVHPTVFLS